MFRRVLLVVDAILIVIAGALGLELYRVVTASHPATSVEVLAPTPPSTAPPPPAPAPAPAPVAAFTVVAERNLFSPNRTEAVPEPPKQAGRGAGPPAPPPPKPRLYGIVVLADGKARAYLEDTQRRKIFAFAVGDSVADSRVEQIKDDRVVLKRGSEVYEVLLRDPTKPKPPPVQATNPFAAAAARAAGGGTAPEAGAAGAAPGMPGAPVNPFAPAAPVNPFAPAAPVNPFAPGAPPNPFVPGAPASPFAPAAPINPFAPGAALPGAPSSTLGTPQATSPGNPSPGGRRPSRRGAGTVPANEDE